MLSLLWRRPRFRRLYLGWAVSMVGDWFTYVAVGLLALRGPQGIFGVALVQMAHSLPKALTAPLAGWLTDRMDRRTLLVVASFARGGITLSMVYAAYREQIEWVEGLLFVRMALQAFILAPESAALPKLVSRAELEPANRLTGTSWAVLFTAGVAVGGLVTGVFGPVTALAIDAVSFFVAGVMFLGLGPLPAELRGARSAGSLLADVRLNPERLKAALAKVPTSLCSGAAWVVLHSLVGAGAGAAYGLGALHAARGVGNGVGPWIFRRFGERRMVLFGALTTMAGAVLVSFDHPVLWIQGCLLWGLGLGATWVGGTVWLQKAVPDAILGRYAALDVGAYGSASAAGGLAAALMTVYLGPTLSVTAVVVVALLGLFAVRPRRVAVVVG